MKKIILFALLGIFTMILSAQDSGVGVGVITGVGVGVITGVGVGVITGVGVGTTHAACW